MAVTGEDAAEIFNDIKITVTEAGDTVTYNKNFGVGYCVSDNKIIYNKEESVETLLKISGLLGDEEYISSGNFIDDSSKTIFLGSQYVDNNNAVLISNNDGGYKIDLQYSWTDKKIDYVVTDDTTISVDIFTDILNLNLIDKQKNKLVYDMLSDGTDDILIVDDKIVYKKITLQGTRAYSTKVNINTDTVPSDGLSFDKDAEGNYLITSASDLQILANYVNAGNNCYRRSFKLTKDIDLSQIANWTPIGTSNIAFRGTFDGDDNTISGLNINSSNNYVGLFGLVGADGTVTKVKLSNVNITGNKYVGGLVGYVNCGYVNNSSFSGTVNSNGRNYVGGIIGSNDGIVKNCTANGTVTGDKYAGGIVGYNQTYSRDDDTGGGEISGNTMVAEVSKTNISGSLVGYLYDGTITNNKYFVDSSIDTIGEKTSSTNITIKDNA